MNIEVGSSGSFGDALFSKVIVSLAVPLAYTRAHALEYLRDNLCLNGYSEKALDLLLEMQFLRTTRTHLVMDSRVATLARGTVESSEIRDIAIAWRQLLSSSSGGVVPSVTLDYLGILAGDGGSARRLDGEFRTSLASGRSERLRYTAAILHAAEQEFDRLPGPDRLRLTFDLAMAEYSREDFRGAERRFAWILQQDVLCVEGVVSSHLLGRIKTSASQHADARGMLIRSLREAERLRETEDFDPGLHRALVVNSLAYLYSQWARSSLKASEWSDARKLNAKALHYYSRALDSHLFSARQEAIVLFTRANYRSNWARATAAQAVLAGRGTFDDALLDYEAALGLFTAQGAEYDVLLTKMEMGRSLLEHALACMRWGDEPAAASLAGRSTDILNELVSGFPSRRHRDLLRRATVAQERSKAFLARLTRE